MQVEKHRRKENLKSKAWKGDENGSKGDDVQTLKEKGEREKKEKEKKMRQERGR